MKAKDPDSLTILRIEDWAHDVVFSFNESDHTVKIDKNTKKIKCTCHHGSNVGVNNTSQICYHKKHVLNKFNGGALIE